MSGVAQNYEERKSNKKIAEICGFCGTKGITTTEEHVLICKFLLSSLHTISAVEICLSKENQLRSFAILVLLSPLSFNFRTVVVYTTTKSLKDVERNGRNNDSLEFRERGRENEATGEVSDVTRGTQ
jgi:hypothetical protein